jgi:hypothetical protein
VDWGKIVVFDFAKLEEARVAMVSQTTNRAQSGMQGMEQMELSQRQGTYFSHILGA